MEGIRSHVTTGTPYRKTSSEKRKNYLINATRVTPMILMEPGKNRLLIKGRSSPDDARGFYERVVKMLDYYWHIGKHDLVVNFNFEYLNSSTAKCLFDLLKKLQSMDRTGMNITINWFYESEDDDMKESGEDFNECIMKKMNLISYTLSA